METDDKKPRDYRKLADQIKDALVGITDNELGSDVVRRWKFSMS